MEATVWLEDEGGARAAQDQAGSLRCTPSWSLEGGVGQGRFRPFVPDPTVIFFTIDVAQSCAREWTHASCFKDY